MSACTHTHIRKSTHAATHTHTQSHTCKSTHAATPATATRYSHSAPLGAKAAGHVVSLHDRGKAQVAQVGAADTGRVLVHLDRWVGSGWGREAGKGMEHCKNNWIGGRRARGVMGAHSEEEG